MNAVMIVHLTPQTGNRRIAVFTRRNNMRYFVNPSEASMLRLHSTLMQLLPHGWRCEPAASGGYFMFPPPEAEKIGALQETYE